MNDRLFVMLVTLGFIAALGAVVGLVAWVNHAENNVNCSEFCDRRVGDVPA